MGGSPGLGREPWSSGYGRRLSSKGHEFESRHRILDAHITYLFAVKFVIYVRKDKNKLKRGRVRPIFINKRQKTNHLIFAAATQPIPESNGAEAAATAIDEDLFDDEDLDELDENLENLEI